MYIMHNLKIVTLLNFPIWTKQSIDCIIHHESKGNTNDKSREADSMKRFQEWIAQREDMTYSVKSKLCAGTWSAREALDFCRRRGLALTVRGMMKRLNRLP